MTTEVDQQVSALKYNKTTNITVLKAHYRRHLTQDWLLPSGGKVETPEAHIQYLCYVYIINHLSSLSVPSLNDRIYSMVHKDAVIHQNYKLTLTEKQVPKHFKLTKGFCSTSGGKNLFLVFVK